MLAGVTTGVAFGETNLLATVRRINFVGDSLTDGAAWTDWVIETLKANGYPHVTKQDAGVAGDNATQLRARFQHDIVDLKPDLVILNIGSVDREPIEEYRRYIEEMIKMLRPSGAKMMLIIPPGICDPNNAARDARVVAVGAVMREVAKEFGCVVVDLHAAFAGGTRAASPAEALLASSSNLTPEEAARTSRILWGPDGVHHTLNGWRTMARVILAALGCHAPLVEKTSLFENAITDWYVGPSIAWSNTAISIPRLWTGVYSGPTIAWSNSPTPSTAASPTPVTTKNIPADYAMAASRNLYPAPPEIPSGFQPLRAGWRKFDRTAEIAKTSWWQKCWLERGGVMPMGQDVVKEKPGSPSYNTGAFSLAIVRSDRETQMTMHVGGSPPYAVWVNGKMVWNGQFLRGYHPSADRITVTLRKGENHILVFTNWLFYMSLGEV